MSRVRDPIDRYITHFRGVLAEIKTLQTKYAALYREVLYVAVLDALSKSAMPHRESNRDRFTSFLQRFCKWPDGERVSLPHLMALVTINPDPAFEKLRLWTIGKHKSMSAHNGGLTPISDDPTFEEVKQRWPGSPEHRTPIGDVTLDALTHYRLFYTYRNMLVHELRRPGRGMDFADAISPYYHGLGDLDEGFKIQARSIELVYPWRFLDQMCDTALDELKVYFEKNSLDPYDSFVFGTYWIRDLNR